MTYPNKRKHISEQEKAHIRQQSPNSIWMRDDIPQINQDDKPIEIIEGTTNDTEPKPKG